MPKNYQYFEIGGTDTYFMNVDGRTPIFPNKLLNWASIIINQQRKKKSSNVFQNKREALQLFESFKIQMSSCGRVV